MHDAARQLQADPSPDADWRLKAGMTFHMYASADAGAALTRLRQYDWGCEIENLAKPWTYESINPMLL